MDIEVDANGVPHLIKKRPVDSSGGGGGVSTGVQTIVAGTNITVNAVDPRNPIVSASSSGTPAGSDTQVQFNDGGAFGAESDLSFEKTPNRLNVGAATSSSNGIIVVGGSGTGIGTITGGGGALSVVGGDLTLESNPTHYIALKTNTVERMRIINSGEIGINTSAPTHTLTLGSTATGFVYYNTADQTTNYERVRQFYSGNIFNIASENGGTGASRSLNITTANTTLGIYESVGTTRGIIDVVRATSGVGALGVTVRTTYTASSGVNVPVGVMPIFNQSGTAGYTALLVNPTETATGSGTKLLADFQVGGTSQFSMSNMGQTVQGNYALTTPVAHFKGGSGGNIIMQFSRGSGITLSQSYAFSLTGGGFAINDVVTSVNTLNAFSTSTSARLTVGQEGSVGNYSAVVGTLSASTHATGAGNNIGGPNLIVQGGGGTGTGTPGDIQFKTFTATSSGATVQTSSVRMSIVAGSGNLVFADGVSIGTGTTTGTQIGTATTHKIGFYGVTPVVQGAAVADATAVLTSIQGQLNLALARLRAVGIIAP